MSIQEIQLQDYDLVTAVTQQSINQTLGQYLYSQQQDIALYGIDDGKGNVSLTTDATKATYTFTGTLMLEQDSNKNYINIVQLKTEKGNPTVQYNVTFQNGRVQVPQVGIDIQQAKTPEPWVFKFYVDLTLQEIDKKNLPEELKKQLENVDENLFSIQQLYMDLNTTALQTFTGIEMPAFLEAPLESMLKAYLQEQQSQNKPLFGVSVHFKDASVTPRSLTPTYVNFCVTPYLDANGNATNPDLDTLNYLVMTDQRQPPAYWPQSFRFNWVDDATIQGVMAIKRDLIAQFIRNEMKPILKGLCPVMYCKADGNQAPPNDAVIQLKEGSDHEFNSTYDPATGQIASYSYSTNASNTFTGPWYDHYTLTVSGEYNMTTKIRLQQNTLQISGSINVKAEIDNDGLPSQSTASAPWSLDLELFMNPEKNGELDFKIVQTNFPSSPSVENYIDNLGDLLTDVQQELLNTLPTLTNILSQSPHFIFPGSKTFSFKTPGFSQNGDLVSTINYLPLDS